MTMGKKKVVYIISALVLAALAVATIFIYRDYRTVQDSDGTRRCGIESCHGLDIVCGNNPPEVCTEMYQLGDKCRKFAKCQRVDGTCQQVENVEFDTCKSCVQKCENSFPNNPEKAFSCESECGE